MSLNKVAGFFLCLTVIVLAGCSKDQKYVKWISAGDYTMTSLTKNGVEEDRGFTLDSHVQTHIECTVKDGDCSGSNTYSGTLVGDSTNTVHTGGSTFAYRIHEKGTKMTVTTLTTTWNGVSTDCTTDCTIEFEIVEMDKDRHVLRNTDDNGDVWVRTMEKM